MCVDGCCGRGKEFNLICREGTQTIVGVLSARNLPGLGPLSPPCAFFPVAFDPWTTADSSCDGTPVATGRDGKKKGSPDLSLASTCSGQGRGEKMLFLNMYFFLSPF